MADLYTHCGTIIRRMRIVETRGLRPSRRDPKAHPLRPPHGHQDTRG
jgi:hypothetical protein